MLTYDEYIKKWPKDYGKSRLQSLYMEYYFTEDVIAMKINKPICNSVAMCNNLCTIDVPPCPSKIAWARDKEKEVDNNMTTYNETEASRKYLNSRIDSVYYDKRDTFAKQFNIYGRSTPTNYKELIDAIKNDKFVLDTKRTAAIDTYVNEDDWYGNAFDGIVFKLDNAPDRAGYDIAEKAACKALKAAKDIINTQDSAAGLKALQDFEAWTYTAPAAQ